MMNKRLWWVCIVVFVALSVATPGARAGQGRAPQAQAATPTPASAATPSTGQPSRGPTTRGMVGPIIGVVLVFMASAVGFGFAMGLRRRINAIAGPDPDAEDDDL